MNYANEASAQHNTIIYYTDVLKLNFVQYTLRVSTYYIYRVSHRDSDKYAITTFLLNIFKLIF